jgi:hypothetical protein
MSETKTDAAPGTVTPVATIQRGDEVPAEKWHYGDDDVGAAVLEESGESFEYTEAEARTVLRKIDLHLLPAVCLHKSRRQSCYSNKLSDVLHLSYSGS